MSEQMIAVYLESGKTRVFAAAVDWPGWCRSGRDEAAALQALVDYAPRYAQVLEGTRLGFGVPGSIAELEIVERLAGNATTDFGAPALSLERDARPVSAAELERMQAILSAGWRAFDRAAQAAQGKELRKGPRGGGRELEKIVEHVREVELAYINSLGGKAPRDLPAAPAAALAAIREAILDGLAASVHGEIPAVGPRGGARWNPRYFARRLAWHDLDHAWEIEDRAAAMPPE
jgi:hypothetical protein